MRIRPAGANDVPDVCGIVERAYGGYVERIGLRPQPMDDDYVEKVRRGEVFVADDQGDVLGLVVLVPAPDHLLIENVAVHPTRQHAGLGRALMAFAEGRAAGHGLTELRLYTNAAMTENLALYPRLGYCEVDRRGDGGFERVFFSKRIQPAT